MGIVNVTPDSFSDGGRFVDPEVAIEHGVALTDAGADLVDVGGESTRPGSAGVTAGEELDRVLPVVRGLVAHGVTVSVDTAKAAVAAATLDAGAEVVNDVTALGDPDMAGVVAAAGAGLVLMHMQGTPRTMQDDPRYDDVVTEVRDHLVARAEQALAAGVTPDRLCLDPGIGFGKTVDHNLELLARLDELAAAGYPVLVGASRKSFLGRLTGATDPDDRDAASAMVAALAIRAGAAAVRVHNVAITMLSARIADAIVRAGRESRG